MQNAARILRSQKNVLILLAGRAVLADAQRDAWRIAHATGAALMVDYVAGRVARGQGRLPLPRVPYNTDMAVQTLSRFEHIILVSAKPPVVFRLPRQAVEAVSASGATA